MEYEAWYNPLFNSDGQLFAHYQSLLTSTNVSRGYDSTDPKIIDQHVKWLTDLGVDAIIAEQSDGGPCDFGDIPMCMKLLHVSSTSAAETFTATIHAINNGSFNLYLALEQRGAPLKIVPVLDGYDPLVYQPRGDGQTPFDVQMGAFYSYVTQYPDMNIIYQGKPLLIVFMASGRYSTHPNSIYPLALSAIKKWQDKFTIRLMDGFIDSQPTLWSTASGIAGLHQVDPTLQIWSYIDRLNPSANLLPSYTIAGNRVEAFTVTSAANSTDQANLWGGNATLYHGGATLDSFFNYAEQLNPIFLIYNQFNEFASQRDEGINEEHSNDIEPTIQWGYAKFNYAKQNLLAYRTSDPAVPVGHLDGLLPGTSTPHSLGRETRRDRHHKKSFTR